MASMSFAIAPGVSKPFAIYENGVIVSHHDTEMDATIAIQDYKKEDQFRELVRVKLVELYKEGLVWPISRSSMIAVFESTLAELKDYIS